MALKGAILLSILLNFRFDQVLSVDPSADQPPQHLGHGQPPVVQANPVLEGVPVFYGRPSLPPNQPSLGFPVARDATRLSNQRFPSMQFDHTAAGPSRPTGWPVRFLKEATGLDRHLAGGISANIYLCLQSGSSIYHYSFAILIIEFHSYVQLQ